MYYDVRLMPVNARTRELKAWVMLLRDITDQRKAAAERDALSARSRNSSSAKA